MANIEHDSIPNADIHEPKGVDTATDGQVYIANGVGGGSWGSPFSGTHDVLITAKSLAATQEPTVTDTPLQLEMGVAQGSGSDPVMLDSLGVVTINQTGRYTFSALMHFGRSGGTGTSHIYFRQVFNGVQAGNTLFAKVDDAEVIQPVTVTFSAQLAAGTEIRYQIIRDSAGNNSGGLVENTPSDAGWNDAPTISVTISRIV